jgi:hypothetical protein
MAIFNIIPNCIKPVALTTSETYYALRVYNGTVVLGINDVGYPSSWWNGKSPVQNGYVIYIPNQSTRSTISTQIASNNSQVINIAKAQPGGSSISNIYDAINYLILNRNCVIMNYNLPNFPTVGLVAFVLSGFSQSFPESFSGLTKTWWSANTASITTPTKNYFTAVNNLELQADAFGITFDGASQYCTINDSTNIPVGNSSYSICCWFNANSFALSGLVGWGNYGTQNQANAFRLTSDGNLVNYWWNNDLTTSGLNLQTGTWYCAICTYDATSNTRIIYLNGSTIVAQDNPSGTHNVTTATNTTIGYTGLNSNYFDGYIINAGIYNTALSAQQAQNYYEAILPYTGVNREFNLLVNPTGSIATTQSIQNINIQH